MSTIVDSYSETNQSNLFSASVGGAINLWGQSFLGDGGILDLAKFYLKKTAGLGGTIKAYIYAHDGGTYGSTGKPTGSPIATSGVINVSTVGTSFGLITFTFTGADKITLVNGTHYFVILDTSSISGGGSDSLSIGEDSTAATHGGNAVDNFATWTVLFAATDDFCFYVYRDDVLPTTTSTTTTSTSTTTTSTTTTSTSTTTTSTSMTTTSTTTSFDPLLDQEFYGMKILKTGADETSKSPRQFFLNTKYPLLPILRQGSFKSTYIRSVGMSITIPLPELPYRPLVFIYMQLMNHDGTLDTDYHLLEWSYWGASKVGYQRYKTYNNRIIIEYSDNLVDDLAINFSVAGYYYAFAKEVGQ